MSTINPVQINVNQNTVASRLTGQQPPQKVSGNAALSQENEGVVYEQSSKNTSEKVIADTKDGKVTEKKPQDRTAIIKQLQDDAEAQKQQLLDIVRKSMTGQASSSATASALPGMKENEDALWAQFADGKVTVTAAAKAQAQEDISENGYWGVEKTSDRIVDFAKTLTGNDSSKAELMMDAFKKGYEQATKSWGRELPEISKKTFEAVNEKLKKWMDESKNTSTSSAENSAKTIGNTNSIGNTSAAQKQASSQTVQNQRAAQAQQAAQARQAAETAAQNTSVA